jgi:hypothetical protein
MRAPPRGARSPLASRSLLRAAGEQGAAGERTSASLRRTRSQDWNGEWLGSEKASPKRLSCEWQQAAAPWNSARKLTVARWK